MTDLNNLLHCYNRGCGKKFDPSDNNEGDCVHHPGLPVFHDAYKGWSCCNKKCTDFTEFLNIKGCASSRHTNEKPPEPERPVIDKSKSHEVIEVKREPIGAETLPRPPFDSPRVTLTPVVSPSLRNQIKDTTVELGKAQDGIVPIGESCKHKGCKSTYKGSPEDDEPCAHHPGVPIFHEGLKYWSCCKKRTTDFTVFLEQPGCTSGSHVWLCKNTNKGVSCRMDWHQTGGYVIVSIFAKKYDPDQSSIELNPIRLSVDLYFQDQDSRYNLDVELRGVINVDESSVNMLPTKVEIKMKKAEPGSWVKLETNNPMNVKPQASMESTPVVTNDEFITAQVDAVDLSDL